MSMNIYTLISEGVTAHFFQYGKMTISDINKSKTYNSEYMFASCRCCYDGVIIEGEDGEETLFKLEGFQMS